MATAAGAYGAPGAEAEAPNHDAKSGAELATTPYLEAFRQEMEDQGQQRSNSPSGWSFKVRSAEAPPPGRGFSGGATGGMTTSQLSRTYASSRAPSGSRPYQQAAARASYESALLAAVRRQIEAFEEKVGGQICRIQTQSERLREAAVTRLEEKVNATEGMQLGRKFAELNGLFKGLSDEMQVQIRRVDSMDERLYDWHHQLKEELRQKHTDFEQGVHKAHSTMRISNNSMEETVKKLVQRVQRLEQDQGGQDSAALNQEVFERVHMLEEQVVSLQDVVALKELHELDSASPVPSTLVVPHNSHVPQLAEGTGLKILEQRVEDMSRKLEDVLADAHEMHARLNQEEISIRTLRTTLQAREEHHRELTERFERSDWGSRLEQLQQALAEHKKDKMSHAERIELLHRRLEHQECSHESLRDAHENMQRQQREARLYVGVAGPHADDAVVLQDGMVPSSSFEVASQPSAAENERLSELITQLKEMVPQVSAQDAAIRELQQSQEQNSRSLQELVPQITSQDTAFRELRHLHNEHKRELEDRHSQFDLTLKFLKGQVVTQEHLNEHHENVRNSVDAIKSEVEEINRRKDTESGIDLNVAKAELADRHSAMKSELRELAAELASDFHGKMKRAVEASDEKHNEVKAQVDAMGEKVHGAHRRASEGIHREEYDRDFAEIKAQQEDFAKLREQAHGAHKRASEGIQREDYDRDFADIKTRVEDLAKMREQVQDAGIQRQDYDRDFADIRTQLEDLATSREQDKSKAAIDELHAKVNQLAAQDQSKAAIDELHAKVNQLATQDQSKAAIDELHAKVNQLAMQDQSKAAFDELHAKVNQLATQDQSKAMINELQAKVNQLAAQVAEGRRNSTELLEEHKRDVRAELDALTEKAEAVAAIRERVEELRAQQMVADDTVKARLEEVVQQVRQEEQEEQETYAKLAARIEDILAMLPGMLQPSGGAAGSNESS